MHPQDAIWPDDGSLPEDDKRHRGKDLFAIDTVNGDTWRAAQEYCCGTQADIVCIQEARITTAEKDDTEATMRATGWSMSIGECGTGAKGGKSAGVAVGTRGHIGMSESLLFEPPGDCSKHRFRIKLVGAALPGGVHVGSLYNISVMGWMHNPTLICLKRSRYDWR